jgi:hypothetical protein
VKLTLRQLEASFKTEAPSILILCLTPSRYAYGRAYVLKKHIKYLGLGRRRSLQRQAASSAKGSTRDVDSFARTSALGPGCVKTLVGLES